MLKINRIELVGNLTDDPTFRDMGEFQYASFILAVDRLAELNDGQTADFIPIVCKNDLAVSTEKYLRKGRQVYIEGRLQIRTFAEDSQNRRWVTEVVARNIQYLDAPPEDNGRNQGGSGQQQRNNNNNQGNQQQIRQGQPSNNRYGGNRGNGNGENQQKQSGQGYNRSQGGGKRGNSQRIQSGGGQGSQSGNNNRQGNNRSYFGSGKGEGSGNGRMPWEN